MYPVGISLGIPGVISLLLNTALDGYGIFTTARALGDDFKQYQRQFEVQQDKLRDWAAGLNLGGDGTTIEKYLKENPKKLELLANTLAQVAKLFADVKKMEGCIGLWRKLLMRRKGG
jgi:hypothetical protein